MVLNENSIGVRNFLMYTYEKELVLFNEKLNYGLKKKYTSIDQGQGFYTFKFRCCSNCGFFIPSVLKTCKYSVTNLKYNLKFKSLFN